MRNTTIEQNGVCDWKAGVGIGPCGKQREMGGMINVVHELKRHDVNV